MHARHCSQPWFHTGFVSDMVMFFDGHIFTQIPHELHFSSTQKLLSILGIWLWLSLYRSVNTTLCHSGPFSTGLFSWDRTMPAIRESFSSAALHRGSHTRLGPGLPQGM